MSGVLALTLGILTALGGFVDIGEIVFASQAGARFGYELLWPIVVGALAIVIYGEMCGRVAIVSKRPVFELVRDRLGYSTGLGVLISSTLVNVLTCAAEIGGVAIILRLITGLPYGWLVAAALLILIAVVTFLPFETIERVFGLMGLFILVFIVSAFVLGIDWGQAAGGLIPHLPRGESGGGLLSYGYFAVGLIAGTVMPYEVQFYSSGNIEERKKPEDLKENALVASVGMAFGAMVTLGILIVAAQVLNPAGLEPQRIGTTMLGPVTALAVPGLLAALLGALFAVGGAAIETSLAGAYGIAQFFGMPWGKSIDPLEVPRFTLSWLAIFGLALLVLASGVDPLEVTEYAVIFSVVVLPLTYLPILLVARDRGVMGEHANDRFEDAIAIVFLIVITVVAIAAVPLMYLSRMGQA
ncbi:MAG TPA: Nramp family divalent metal transporter [Candidatus Limnocylindrales bacterium]|nr:Nramp family divalent metal transporter [Candidatus Limnocylindrales bacterium]